MWTFKRGGIKCDKSVSCMGHLPPLNFQNHANPLLYKKLLYTVYKIGDLIYLSVDNLHQF